MAQLKNNPGTKTNMLFTPVNILQKPRVIVLPPLPIFLVTIQPLPIDQAFQEDIKSISSKTLFQNLEQFTEVNNKGTVQVNDKTDKKYTNINKSITCYLR